MARLHIWLDHVALVTDLIFSAVFVRTKGSCVEAEEVAAKRVGLDSRKNI